MLILLVINVIVFGFLAVIWRNNDSTNLFIKLVLIALFLANAFFAMSGFGYIVQLPESSVVIE